MAKKQTDTPEEIKRPSLRSLFDKILSTLEGVTPERRLDFISKNLPLLLKYRESGQGNSWSSDWGD